MTITAEKVAALLLDVRTAPRDTLGYVCAAERFADFGTDMADLIAKQAAELEGYKRGSAHSLDVFSMLKSDYDKQAAEIERLLAFKDYVHQRLDDAGIQINPDGEHSKAGCRIGDRLDLALKEQHP